LKALVTGATGFIGSHLADLLLEKGYQVRCIYRKTSNLIWLKDKPFELIEAGLSDPDSLKNAVEGIDYIFHSAGLVTARNDEEYLKANRDGTKNLLEAALKYAPNLKRFLLISSQTAVGPSASLDNPVNEKTPLHPITAYGRSKKAAEEEALKYIDRLPITIVRPPAVYGPRDIGIYDIFKVVNKGLITLIGFKKKYISLINSWDLCRGILLAAESENSIGKSYFISSDKFYSWEEVMGIIKTEFGKKHIITIKIPHSLVLSIAGISEFFGRFSKKPPIFNYDKGKDFIQNFWTCSIENAKKDIGYEPKVSLEEGIRATLNWYKENSWL